MIVEVPLNFFISWDPRSLITNSSTPATELKSKLSTLKHTALMVVKCHLKDYLLNYNLVLDRDISYELGITFNFKNKNIT